MPQKKNGVFITVEGGEGVGKSSFIQNLKKLLHDQLGDVQITREPGGTYTAEKLRSIFKLPSKADPLTKESELLIVAAARSQHITHFIKPNLVAGRWVLCDRFIDSTLVYQGALGGLERNKIDNILAFASQNVQPDITFLLDCEIDISLKRLSQRSELEAQEPCRFDEQGRSFHEKVRKAYLSLAESAPGRIVKLDASKASMDSAIEAYSILQERFDFA